MKEKVKIWIPGATGMLGSHMENLLREREISCAGKEVGRIDITNLVAVRDFVKEHQITHIINCAAYTQVDKAESEKEQAFQGNVIGPQNLGIAATERGIKVLHFSTDYVFSGDSKIPYEEKHPCAPQNVYGATKWEGEKRLLEAAQNACIVRTSWLFGLRGKNFVDTMLRLMQDKENLKIVSDQMGRPTFCQDLAEVALELLEQEGIFHVANANQTSWYHFATEIYHTALSLGYHLKVKTLTPITTAEYPTPAKRPAYSTLSTQKLESTIAYKPRVWQEALKDYMRQHQQQYMISQAS